MPQTHETDTCEVLVVRNLNVAFRQQDAPEVQAVRQLSFSLRRGETLAIVGESGSGKSVTALALMRLLDAASSEVSSEGLWLRRRNRQVIALNEQSEAEMRRVRGADLAMIFQEPMTSLNPVFTIGEQIAESLRLHQGLGRDEALRAAKKMLDQVRIPQAEEMLTLSAPALRRHAPAGDDRHGALLSAGGADCRRADHGAGCHHPGANFATYRRPAKGDGDGGNLYHP